MDQPKKSSPNLIRYLQGNLRTSRVDCSTRPANCTLAIPPTNSRRYEATNISKIQRLQAMFRVGYEQKLRLPNHSLCVNNNI